MAYITNEPPPDPANLPEYLSRELRTIAEELRAPPRWTSAVLLSPWANIADYQEVEFSKSDNGIVTLRGMTGKAGNGTQITYLPEGYWPLNKEAFVVSRDFGDVGRVEVNTNGFVVYRGTTPTDFISLSGIQFSTES